MTVALFVVPSTRQYILILSTHVPHESNIVVKDEQGVSRKMNLPPLAVQEDAEV